MSLWWIHLRLLLWKDVWTYQFRRHTFLTLLQLLVPAAIILLYVYTVPISDPAVQNPRLGLDVFAWAAVQLGDNLIESDNLTWTDERVLVDVESQTETRSDAEYLRIMFRVFPCLVSLCMMQPFLVKKTTSELCTGTKELMVANGLAEFLWWLGSFCWSFIMLLAGALPVLTLTKTHALLPHANVLLLFFGTLLHCILSALYCLLVATLVPRPSVGLVTTSFVVFASIVIPFGLASSVPSEVKEGGIQEMVITLCLLLPNVGFSYFLVNVADLGYGAGAPGARFSNVAHVGLHGTSVYRAVHAMVGSCFLTGVLCWYLSNVWPHGYSFPENFWFFLQPSYWGYWRSVGVTEENLVEVKENMALFEPLREQKQAHLVIYKLSKVLDPLYLKYHIIHDVTMKIYMDSITVFLGRNGCGKSVLIRMLAGAIKPSSGTAFFDGLDIRTNLERVRANTGYCPQNNTLIPFLTVEENLLFTAELREAEDIEDLILTVLMQFQLLDAKDTLASKITYAEQRRLQVALALLEAPEFALFDSPTAGIDSDSRNIIWDAILRARAQTTVVLATNSTDEAEILADRIAIISRSLISCCGSSVFLRKKYGEGYRLQLYVSSKCDKSLVCSFVEKRLPVARKELDRRNIIVYTLGFASVSDLVRLLQQLEDSRVKLRVRRISVTASSLEDVLLRLDETTRKEDAGAVDEEKGEALSPDAKVPELRSDLLRAQMSAIMTKKTTYLRRSYLVAPLLLLGQVAMLSAEEKYLRTGTLAWKRLEDRFENFVSPKGSGCIYRLMSADANEQAIRAVETAVFELHTAVFAQRLASMVLVPVSMSLAASAYVDLPLKERVSGLKLVQLMAGLSSERYWLATFATDLLTHVVSSLFCTLPVLFLDADLWQCRDHYKIGTTFGLYFMFGWAFFPLTYIASLMFESSLLAYFSLVSFGALFGTVFNVCLSVFAPRTVSTFRAKREQDNYVQVASLPLRFMPQFTLTRGTGQLRSAYLERASCCHLGQQFLYFVCTFAFKTHTADQAYMVTRLHKCCTVSCDRICPVYGEDIGSIALGSTSHVWDLAILFLSGLLYLVLVIGWDLQTQGSFDPKSLESFFNQEPDQPGGKEPSNEEKSVREEKRFVAGLMQYLLTADPNPAKNGATAAGGGKEGGEEGGDASSKALRAPAGLVVLEVTKTGTLGPLSFHVPPGEVFGILGLGQAGRSLLLRIITGTVRPCGGNVYINGIDASQRPLNYQQQVGYCPQQDPLVDKYTGEEMVLLMARLRGVMKHDLQNELRYLEDRLGLRKFLSLKISKYSSANRRLLSVAMALAGRPPLVVLDECTAGVDPAARSRLFQSVGIVHSECNLTVLFTSRRMAESDIFCDRLAILSYGNFTVLGRTIDIKQTCGQRCNVVVKMSSEQHGKKASKIISRAVSDMFPNSVIAEVRKDQIWFRIKDDSIYWSDVFDGLETLKGRLKFGDYLVNDMSLGEIYLGYARERKLVDFGTIEIKYFDKLKPPSELETTVGSAVGAPSGPGQSQPSYA